MTAEFTLNKLKRGTLRKQQSHYLQQSNNDTSAAFIYTRSQQKCNNISIQLPFEIRTNEKDSLDASDSLANNNLFLQTPVLKLKIDKSLQEISPMEINRISTKNEPISIFSSKCDLTSPNRNMNNNLQNLDLSYEKTTTTTVLIAPPATETPNIDSNKKKHKAPTTPHRILCQFRSMDAAVSEESPTKTVHENNNENDMDHKSSKVCIYLLLLFFFNFLVISSSLS